MSENLESIVYMKEIDNCQKYDSTNDTKNHIHRVREFIDLFFVELNFRRMRHDMSKLTSPEKEIFDYYTQKLKNTTYGSEEYKTFLREMKPALDHHYEKNSHHPEHYSNGINGMNLVDLVEMLCDWKAATERHDDGCIHKSLEINKERFGVDDQLYSILKNTIKEFF